MKIIVGFSRHPGFAPMSWAICAVEGTRYSHAYVKIRADSLDRNLIYQATGIGVYFVGERNFLTKAIPIEEYEFEISDGARTAFLQKAVDNCGIPYSKSEVIGMGVVRLFGLFGKKIKNPFADGKGAYICVELVTEVLQDFDLIPDSVDADNIGLKELNLHVKNLYRTISTAQQPTQTI